MTASAECDAVQCSALQSLKTTGSHRTETASRPSRPSPVCVCLNPAQRCGWSGEFGAEHWSRRPVDGILTCLAFCRCDISVTDPPASWNHRTVSGLKTARHRTPSPKCHLGICPKSEPGRLYRGFGVVHPLALSCQCCCGSVGVISAGTPDLLLGALGLEGPGQATDLGAKLSTHRRVSRFVRLRGPEAPSHQGRPWLTTAVRFLEPLGKLELCCGAFQMAHGSLPPAAEE